MTPKRNTITFIVIAVVLLGLSGLFTVREGQQAMISRLGELKKDSAETVIAYEPGLHYKMPFVERVLKFDVRLQTLEKKLDEKTSRIMTGEQKEVMVDYFVKWRISNLATYYTRTGGQFVRAERLLEQQVESGLRAEFGRRTIREVVTDDRAAIMTSLNEGTNANAQKLGIDVVDVRIKRIDLPTKVSKAVFERMRTEREQVAKEHRATGLAVAEGIRADADASATVIVATARNQANETRAKGDGLAATIYADAYNQDPEFYAFFRSLTAYLRTFSGKDSTLVLSPDSQFFDYFNNALGETSQKKTKQNSTS